jgi:hypothetical protein
VELEDWPSTRNGLSTLVEIAKKVGESESQRITDDFDVLISDHWADNLEWATDDLKRPSLSEDRLKLARVEDARIARDLADELRQRISELGQTHQAEP